MAKRRAEQQQEVIDIGQALGVSEDEQLATTDANAVRVWLRGIAGFFTTARAMEESSGRTLVEARRLVTPKTEQEDLAIQRFVKQTTEDRKAVEGHWDIALVVNRFHKRLTAARSRATAPLEEANGIGNRLHATYSENERRRAQEEQDRIRREAEEQARLDRERELARAEEEAVRLEEASEGLSEREKRFVELFAFGLNTGPTAARAAGFKDPAVAASRLLKQEKIIKAVKAVQEAAALRKQAEARRAQPLDVEVATVRPNISKAAGAHDRTSYSAEVFDPRLFVEAVIGGKHGIPADALMPNNVTLNEYARSLRDRINLWPGCRLKKITSVV